jgi:hypothetical protein
MVRVSEVSPASALPGVLLPAGWLRMKSIQKEALQPKSSKLFFVLPSFSSPFMINHRFNLFFTFLF